MKIARSFLSLRFNRILFLFDSNFNQFIALFNLLQYIHACGELAENRMMPVEMRLRFVADKELAAVGIGSGVGHR